MAIQAERVRLQVSKRAKVLSAATDNPTVVKDGPGELRNVTISNANASARFIKFYDKATAPSVADTVAFTLRIPAQGFVAFGEGAGVEFSVGISYRLTAGTGLEADTTAVAANEIQGVIGYV